MPMAAMKGIASDEAAIGEIEPSQEPV
jgi:hypothetical protein